ncbi:tumor necrosis factor receptor superfamily member 27 isoform X2 [Rhinatrema bivittatum]|uniref:tumor necrosis factor receptor superfamily member 27 isoform X2 n=1 Tax=Rhinatrema bivittatum TaxID=194408 RepID=UPI001129AB4E|nr:tumor necrosis factor receptor superfamily member 27 isoform X2 [Rhinatrema bivittatum]
MRRLQGCSLLLLVLLTELCHAFANPLECQESEYRDVHGRCSLCQECGPGQELSKECGYGEGGDAQCVACQTRRYKNDRGRHRCKTCLSCILINRTQKFNCSANTNTVCGECLPGFYSKTRIGGLLDQECIPCTQQTPITEFQCLSRMRQPKPVPPTVAPQDTAVLAAVTSTALALLLLAVAIPSILYCGRFVKRQAQRAFLRSEDGAGQRVLFAARPPCDAQHPTSASDLDTTQHVQGPVEEVQQMTTISSTGSCDVPCPLQPDLQLDPILLPVTKPQLARSVSETQPLIRNSGCSDCSASCSVSSEVRQGPTGCVDPFPQCLASAGASCASEQQHWAHAPVECTELDLQTFSAKMGFTETEDQDHAKKSGTRNVLGSGTELQAEADNSEQLEGACTISSPGLQPMIQQKEMDEFQSQVASISSVTQGLHIAQLPPAMVLLLSLKLDPFLPRARNFMDVGADLGVPAEHMKQMMGFGHLHTYLSCSGACTILSLLQSLYKLQRWDALSLLCDHLAQNSGRDCQEHC